MMVIRKDRTSFALRKIEFKSGFITNATGSVLAVCGNTQVICAVSFSREIPRWLKEKTPAQGWLTAEYAMLPASTGERVKRENKFGASGRSSEIQRLIGRSLRMAVDLKKLAGYTVFVDCDVLNADGGTRCTAINGGFAALKLAVKMLLTKGELQENPIIRQVSAVSVGICEGKILLDLCYEEDSSAEVDMNVVMADGENLIEIQGTGEKKPFSLEQMQKMVEVAKIGIQQINDKIDLLV